jgi:GNAT superfamily N-acetyltransferase
MGFDIVMPRSIQVTIRRADAADADRLRRFLVGLSERTTYHRFFTGLGRVPNRLLAWLLPPGSSRVVLVAVHDGEIVGHGMYSAVAGEETTADLAVVVADAWQRRGIGPRLVEGLLDIGVDHGVRTVRFTILAGNLPANRLAARFWPGARPELDQGVYEYVLPVDVARATA